MVEMFRGTIDNASVYPREIVKECLALNAACVILVHNHPSGDVEPSAADRAITAKIKAALALVDIRVLDHIIVSGKDSFSFAEAGLL
jgi:DNA repair protein RadC